MSPDAKAEALTRGERFPDIVPISAWTGEGTGTLEDMIARRLDAPRSADTLRLTAADGRARAWLYEQNVVTDERQDGEITEIDVLWTDVQKARYHRG